MSDDKDLHGIDGEEVQNQRAKPFIAAGQILQSISRLAAGIVGFAIFAYFAGWIYAKEYFGTFGATWVLRELTLMDVVNYSWHTLSLLAIMLWLTLLDLSDVSEGSRLIVRKLSRKILSYGWWISLLLLLASSLLLHYNVFSIGILLGYLSWIGYITFAASAFEMLVVLVHEEVFVGDSFDSVVSYGFALSALYFAPVALGSAQAYQDAWPGRSSMPHIILREEANHSSQSLRLLHVGSDTYYGISLSSTDDLTDVKIFALPQNKVAYVRATIPDDSTKADLD